MITYIDKGYGLHMAIRAAGHALRQENGEWLSSDDAAVQAIIDTYDPLPELQQAVWEAIKIEREKRKAEGVTVAGKRFHSDPDSRIQQLGLVLRSSNIPPGLMWKTLDGSFVEMTPALAAQIFDATAMKDVAVFRAAEIHRATMMQMAWPAVTGYDFSAGWPEL